MQTIETLTAKLKASRQERRELVAAARKALKLARFHAEQTNEAKAALSSLVDHLRKPTT